MSSWLWVSPALAVVRGLHCGWKSSVSLSDSRINRLKRKKSERPPRVDLIGSARDCVLSSSTAARGLIPTAGPRGGSFGSLGSGTRPTTTWCSLGSARCCSEGHTGGPLWQSVGIFFFLILRIVTTASWKSLVSNSPSPLLLTSPQRVTDKQNTPNALVPAQKFFFHDLGCSLGPGSFKSNTLFKRIARPGSHRPASPECGCRSCPLSSWRHLSTIAQASDTSSHCNR